MGLTTFENTLREKAIEIRGQVHQEVKPLRDEVFRVKNYTDLRFRLAFKLWKRLNTSGQPHPQLPQFDTGPPAQLRDGADLKEQIERLDQRAQWYEERARKSQKEVEDLAVALPETLLRITTRAGVMLAWTEDLVSSHDHLTSAASAAATTKSPSTGVLSRTLTVAATARDHVSAVRGNLLNLKDVLASLTRRVLSLLLLGFAAVYIAFHPMGPLSTMRLPVAFRPEWEIFFWSLFGAITISLVYTADDVAAPEFDIRNVAKWAYRMLVAAPIAFGFLMLLDAIGFAPGGAPIVDFANPDYPTLISLAFLAGVSGRATLETLGDLWGRFTGGAGKTAGATKGT